MLMKFLFSVREVGVGGRVVVVPIARFWDGGEVGRRDSVWVFDDGLGWMYCDEKNRSVFDLQ